MNTRCDLVAMEAKSFISLTSYTHPNYSVPTGNIPVQSVLKNEKVRFLLLTRGRTQTITKGSSLRCGSSGS